MSETKDWRKICADCQEGEPPKDCEYYGEPNGCNSPTYGEHPSVGNGAKCREALAAFLALWDDGTRRSVDKLYQVIKQMREALSAPPRNCDLYNNVAEAWRAYVRIHPDDTAMNPLWHFSKWLFAEAKGGAE